MKRHTFKVIQWLGESRSQVHDRYAVVEVDKLGPVLRGGPYATQKYANERANDLEARAFLAPRPTREGRP